MVTVELDAVRRDILATSGHLVVEGGPGCGKTTIALLKARQAATTLEPDQRVVFLSFSRAAVRQVTERMPGVLARAERDLLEVRTFHSFFLDLVRSHARLLTGRPARFITPEREAQLRVNHDGDWADERVRLAREDSIFVFDTLAGTAADLLERSASLRALYNAMYPMVIVDEFQDTNDDQWRVIKALAPGATVVCLADPDQRIFEYLEGVDDRRLPDAKEHLIPAVFDLSKDNHRSPGAGLLDYANAVLRNQPSSSPTNVYQRLYRYEAVELMAHWGVAAVRQELTQRLGRQPTIAVLTRANSLAARISEAMDQQQTMGDGGVLLPVEHVLQWDPDRAAASGYVVASLLEWPGMDRDDAVVLTLQQIAEYYRLKLGQGIQGARTTLNTLDRAVTAIRTGRAPASKTAKLLLERAPDIAFGGQPVTDWQSARSRLGGSTELDEVFKEARLLRLLDATDALAWALLERWDGDRSYPGAVAAVRQALAEETVNAARQDPAAVSIMTMHKSKGKEFDAVIIVEGRHQGPLIREESEHQAPDRRLLRVAITRARSMVLFVRPHGAAPLTP